MSKNEQLKTVFKNYILIVRVAQAQTKSVDLGIKLGHIENMCGHGIESVENDMVHKAMRWLGFIQGVLWAHGFRTIDAMCEDNDGLEA